MGRAAYKVAGMTCGVCARSVTAAITALAPGVTAEVALERGIVTVTGDVSPHAVRQAVDRAGFDFLGPA